MAYSSLKEFLEVRLFGVTYWKGGEGNGKGKGETEGGRETETERGRGREDEVMSAVLRGGKVSSVPVL